MRVAQIDTRAESLCQTGFYVHHYLHGTFGVGVAVSGQTEHLLYMHLESLTNLSSSLIVQQIVVTVAHAQPVLGYLYGVHVAVHFVGCHVEGQIGCDTFLIELCQQRIKLFLALQRTYFLQFGLNRCNAVLIQLHAIHGNLVQVAHLLCHAAGFVLGGSQFFDKALNLLAVVLGQHGERTILRILIGQRIVFHPATAGILIEVGTRQSRGIEIGKLNAGRQLGRLLARVARCCQQADSCNGKKMFHVHSKINKLKTKKYS